MRYPKEFWLLSLLLDCCYTHCQEDDLGALLGALNPGIFADGLATVPAARIWFYPETAHSGTVEPSDVLFHRIHTHGSINILSQI